MFKRNFLIYTLAGAAAAGVLSDILMIAFTERFSYSEKDNMYPWIFLLPTLFAAACAVFIKLWARRTIRKRRAWLEVLEVRDEYSFFRNSACILAGMALANTCWLYLQLTGTMKSIYTEELRQANLMLSSEPQEYRSRMLRELANRESMYLASVRAVFIFLLLAKLAVYLFSARGFVRQYHAAAPSAKPQRKRRRASSDI